MDLTLLIFIVTYAGIAFGKFPFFRVDRTGAALIGAIAMIVTQRLTPTAAWSSVDFNTVALLFGLMVVSASFAVAGFYQWTAAQIASLQIGPGKLLAVLIVAAAVLSAVLNNDVVVVAMTPLLVEITLARGLNPLPFLLAFCFTANTGSTATLIGSPQNMIVGSGLHLSFNDFLKVAGIPALLSLPIVWGIIVWMFRHRWTVPTRRILTKQSEIRIPFNRVETAKATIITIGVILAFIFTSWPHSLVALGAAGVLLLNRKIASSDILNKVDGDLLLLLFGLYIVNAALTQTGLPTYLVADLRNSGFDLANPQILLWVMALISNTVGNTAAVILMMPYIGDGNAELTAAAMALGTGFSSNLVVFGSLAGIIVTEAARRHDVTISFWEFSRAGAPVFVACMLLAAGWIMLIS